MSEPGTRRVSAAALVATLGEQRSGPGPAFRSLAAAIVRAVDRGDLPGATLLPSERALAAATGWSRGTVVAAYEVLREDGVVLRRRGSGTWVRSATANDGLVELFEHDAAVRARRLTARVVDPRPEIIDLGLSVLGEPWALDGIDLGATPAQLVAAGGSHGYLPNGIPELREAIAERYCRAGLPTTAEHISITHGAQHAISLTARLLVHAGDTVVLESPTFPGAIDAFSRAGARFTTVASDSGGADVEQLTRRLQRGPVRAVYLVPTCHSATGSIMPEHRRRAIAEQVDASDAWLIEDETLAPLRFATSDSAATDPASIATHGRTDRYVAVGSLSKQVWAGLRVGWLRADPRVIERLARLRAATDLGGSIQAQLVALRCLDGLEPRTESLRTVLAARSRHLRELLAQHLSDWSVPAPEGGLSLWCRLPGPLADELAAVAPGFGVSVLAGSATSADDAHADCVRVSFALPEAVLHDGVLRLADAWRSLGRAAGSPA